MFLLFILFEYDKGGFGFSMNDLLKEDYVEFVESFSSYSLLKCLL